MSKLEEWVEQALVVVSRSGDELIAECPWCGRPKLWINLEKRRWLCYRGCGKGAAINLVRKVDGVGRDKAKHRIDEHERTGDDLLDALMDLNRGVEVDEELIAIDLPDTFVPCFNGDLWRVPKYASNPPPEGRGLDDDDLVRHGIGYVGSSKDKWRKRLIVPVSFRGHRTFVARLMGPPSKYAWKSKEGETVIPKRYLYPKGSHTGKLLYWGDHIRPGADLIVVEGIFDCIRLVGLGFDCVATFGKTISEAQKRALGELKPESVTVMYDEDARSDAVLAALEISERVSAFVALVDDDPDTLGYYDGADAIEAALSERWKPASELDALAFAVESL